MAQYSTGTIATNGTAVIVGTGTNWSGNVVAGNYFIGPNNLVYTISNVNVTGLEITLTTPYGGPNVSGASYVIHIDFLNGRPVLANDDVQSAAILNEWITKTVAVDDNIIFGTSGTNQPIAPSFAVAANATTAILLLPYNGLSPPTSITNSGTFQFVNTSGGVVDASISTGDIVLSVSGFKAARLVITSSGMTAGESYELRSATSGASITINP